MKINILILVWISLFTCCCSVICMANNYNDMYNTRDFGAKGDGKTLDTKAIQAAIDQCNANGGGKVYINNGCFVSGTIYLKSNVTLHIESGAILQASGCLGDFPIISSKYPSYTGDFVTNKMLIYAEDARNITISGRGTIDGRGDDWKEGPYGAPSFSLRPRIIHFRGCENIHIRDITLYNSASWVQSYQSCKNMVIDGITVDSRENKDIEKPRHADAPGRNTDGLDLVDCQTVRISNCFINSGDDSIVLKSLSPDEGCQDIVINNCLVSANANGIKIGTETRGWFRDITIQNCVVFDTRGDAISIMTTDGAMVERVSISNISVRNVKGTAIFLRLGNRNRLYRKNAVLNTPYLKDIIIENIQGTNIASEYCCSISGTRNIKVENIVLRNINLHFEGGGKKEDTLIEVAEKETSYPNGRMFGTLPAYGFFIRHAKNITLENIQMDFSNDDYRPALFCDNVEQLQIKGFKALATQDTRELIRLINTREVIITESQPTSAVPVFLGVYGDKSNMISLQNNILRNAKEKYVFGNEARKKILTETGTISK